MRYPFSVSFTKEGLDSYWVAKSACLKGCIGVGDTTEAAIAELEENETAWLETAAKVGLEIPEVPVEEESTYSGKLSLRISKSVHERAALEAKKEGISLNQFINDAIVSYTSQAQASMYISNKVTETAQYIGRKSLSAITRSESSNVLQFPLAQQLVYRTN